jgi:hypothetical protein
MMGSLRRPQAVGQRTGIFGITLSMRRKHLNTCNKSTEVEFTPRARSKSRALNVTGTFPAVPD